MPEAKVQSTSLDKHRIAVLPFVKMGAATGKEYFSDRIADEMITDSPIPS